MDFRRSLLKYVKKYFGGSEDHGLNIFKEFWTKRA